LYEGSFAVIGGNFDHAGEVSSGIKAILKRMGLSSDVIRKVSLQSISFAGMMPALRPAQLFQQPQ